MVIGHGDIASVLPDRDDLTFFASGVSNSAETDEKAYAREIDLLRDTALGPTRHLVYFSSMCVFYSDTRYARHKREVEGCVRSWFEPFTILRLGTITWGKNPHTLINFLRARYKAGLPLDIHDTYRYLVTPDELKFWLTLIPDWSCEMNIGRRMKVGEIVAKYITGKHVYA